MIFIHFSFCIFILYEFRLGIALIITKRGYPLVTRYQVYLILCVSALSFTSDQLHPRKNNINDHKEKITVQTLALHQSQVGFLEDQENLLIPLLSVVCFQYSHLLSKLHKRLMLGKDLEALEMFWTATKSSISLVLVMKDESIYFLPIDLQEKFWASQRVLPSYKASTPLSCLLLVEFLEQLRIQ